MNDRTSVPACEAHGGLARTGGSRLIRIRLVDLAKNTSRKMRNVDGLSALLVSLPHHRAGAFNPNRKIFEARKRETAALGTGEKLVLGHPLAATIGDSARCMQNLEKVLFTGPKTSDTVTFICD